MHNYSELNVWKEGILLAKEVYTLRQKFPKDELLGLTSQIRRCVVSIPSNIAEGSGRDTANDFNQFLAIATGSSFELDTQLMLSKEFCYITDELFSPVLDRLEIVQKCYTV
jgi:four helix bundle protein